MQAHHQGGDQAALQTNREGRVMVSVLKARIQSHAATAVPRGSDVGQGRSGIARPSCLGHSSSIGRQHKLGCTPKDFSRDRDS